ncbi:MAG: glycosyltransferase family 39 protein, partial [Patescibacteria group bacterium]
MPKKLSNPKRDFLIALVVPLSFLLVGALTLSDYGHNSDEPFHFYRGQAYLRFFLNGEKDYRNLHPYPRLNDEKCRDNSSDCKSSPPFPADTGPYVSSDYRYEDAINQKFKTKGVKIRRSFYQNDSFTFEDVVNKEDGHPPLGGILASGTNYIFYQKLAILGDIESYHLAEVLAGFLGIVAVSIFTLRNFGLWISLISSLSIALYPLFFSESHFNIKDTFLASFFCISLVLFYFGIKELRWYKIILSAFFAGLALGVKFNVLFLHFIIVPWL